MYMFRSGIAMTLLADKYYLVDRPMDEGSILYLGISVPASRDVQIGNVRFQVRTIPGTLRESASLALQVGTTLAVVEPPKQTLLDVLFIGCLWRRCSWYGGLGSTNRPWLL
jgi:hypothetical protein